jgi:hypothetical protein
MSGAWIAVASAEHVARGIAGGFMQVCHGKAGPLRRVKPGDRVAYYSPTRSFGGKDVLRAFTAVGVVKAGEPYAVDCGGGFVPFRRDVEWCGGEPAPVAPLLHELAFAKAGPNWGAKLRFGLVAVEDGDLARIAAAMRAVLPVR